MGDQAIVEEALLAGERAVDELVDEYELTGRQILAQRPAGGNGDQVGDAGAFQRVDVGAVVDAGWRVRMSAAVTRQEADGQTVDFGEQDFVGWFAPGTSDLLPGRVLQVGQGVEAAASDDSENRFHHGFHGITMRLLRTVLSRQAVIFKEKS